MSHKKGFTHTTKLGNLVSGFTLLEILLVVGIISVLAGIVIIAINPGKQLATVRNTERVSDLKQVNNAMQQYYIDNRSYPAVIPTTLSEICATGNLPGPQTSITCGTLIDLSLLVPDYMTAIPVDPSGASSTLTLITPAYAADGGTGYKMGVSPSNKLIASAPLAEQGDIIIVGTTGTTTGSTGSTTEQVIVYNLQQGLLAYYPLDADINDYSGNGHDGSLIDSPVLSTTEKKVGAGSYYFSGFQGINTNFQAGPGASQFSACVWQKETTVSYSSCGPGGSYGECPQMAVGLWGSSDGLDYPWFIGVDGTDTGSQVGGRQDDPSGTWFGTYGGSETLNNWIYTCMTFEQNQNLILYQNGVEVSRQAVLDYPLLNGSTETVRIGTSILPASWWSTYGYIDEVTMWNRVLTSTDISNLYNSGSGRSLMAN